MVNNLLALLRGTATQKEMAEKYKVSQQGWASWESGRTVPKEDTMLQMERDFDLPMEVIFFEVFDYKHSQKHDK